MIGNYQSHYMKFGHASSFGVSGTVYPSGKPEVERKMLGSLTVRISSTTTRLTLAVDPPFWHSSA